MKTKKQDKSTPRVRVGSYSAFVNKGKVKVIGFENGEEFEVESFTKENVADVRSLIENATPENKAKAEAKLTLLRDELASVEKIRASILGEINVAKQETRNVITLYPSYQTAEVINDNITVGCTTISVRTFDRLEKLLRGGAKK